MKKAAVVIGVNRTGGLPPLESAAAGARDVAAWLKKEGFDVVCLTDEKKPVTSQAVSDALERFVTLPVRYHLLVVYFSGHGQWHSRVDHWLLSGAPARASEAIDLRAAIDGAQYSGIDNVVIVSDACRSPPDSVSGQRVTGVPAFPNLDISKPSKVDSFCAAGLAQAAYEGVIDGKSQSLLTAALRSAYVAPEPSMVMDAEIDGKPAKVVPNRRLEDYLRRKVDEMLLRIDRTLRQQIEVNVPSDDKVYIARVTAPRKGPSRPASPVEEVIAARTPGDAPDDAWADARSAASVVRSELRDRAFAHGNASPILAVQRASVEGRIRRRMPDVQHDHFESGTGFVVHGAAVAAAVWRAGMAGGTLETRLLDAGGGDAPGLVRVEGPCGDMNLPPQAVGSVGLRFADGRCTLLAALPGYLGHVRVKVDGVAGVNYVPTAYGPRWAAYDARRAEIDRLRAMVNLAAEHGGFQLPTAREAQFLAERIRLGKSLDPTLGVYAAHAYAQAGRDSRVLELLDHMRPDLMADLFDVRLLASRQLGGQPFDAVPVVPACPMLTQGWSLLATRRVVLPARLQRAGALLCNSLWTTFEPAAADDVMAWLAGGDDA